MNSKLIVFDLFGTLVESPEPVSVKELLDEIEIHAGGEKGLYQRWLSSSEERDRGTYASPDAYWEAMQVQDATKANLLYQRGNSFWLERLRPGVIETLAHLKDNGFDIVLCSNAGFETNNIFKNNIIYGFFNRVIISAEVKALKPEAKMYEEALGKGNYYLEKYFIGDGGSNELAGAEQNGFTPLHLSEYREGKEVYRDLAVKYQNIDNLSKLIELFS